MEVELMSQLFNHAKLERDAALRKLTEEYVPAANADLIRKLELELLKILDGSAQNTWESRSSSLLAATVIIDAKRASEDFVNSAQSLALRSLVDEEVRVRLAAGELLGAICRYRGTAVYEQCRDIILKLITENLERNVDQPISDDSSAGSLSRSDSFDEARKSVEIGNILHDTAGWRNLETSMKCLQSIVEGCGPSFLTYVDRNLLDLIFQTLTHTNRFVRETGYFLCASLVSCTNKGGVGSEFASDRQPSLTNNPLLSCDRQFTLYLAKGLADNWSQVRLAASIATRNFLLYISPEVRETYFDQLLPPLCLNRYYLAEGVRLYNQETWALLVGNDGRRYVKDYIGHVAGYYIEQTKANNHAVREASCHCIAELAVKIDPESVRPFVVDLLETLLTCFNDDSWPVRDAACLACGNFLSCFIEEGRAYLDRLIPLFFANLSDCIPSVREGAAESLAKVVVTYGNDCLDQTAIPYLKAGFKKVEEQPTLSAEVIGQHRTTFRNFAGLEKGLTTFGVAKTIRDNDADRHTDQQMYSCGSLAPKMGRGSGGCCDRKFRRPTSPWEITDGCALLLAELATAYNTPQTESQKSKLANLLPDLAAALSHRNYVEHVQLLETVFKRLNQMANGFGKRHFKAYMDEFMEPLFYSMTCGCALTETAADQALVNLAKFLGPSILRAKIEAFQNARYLSTYDRTMQQYT